MPGRRGCVSGPDLAAARCGSPTGADSVVSVTLMTSLTRGPLPARVYWTRRVLLLGVAFALVFGIARVLTLGSDASSPPPSATQAAADTIAEPLTSPTSTYSARPTKQKTPKVPVLADPDGPCADDDIAITPKVKKAVAGRDVFVVLKLRTITSEACTWRVSRDSVTLKISSGKDDIWSSRQCPRAIVSTPVVVRRAVSTSVGVTWHGRRSDEECSRLAGWALPGFYHLTVAALSGEPSDIQFELAAPTPEVITRSPEPKKTRGEERGTNKQGGRPVASPSPSGATEPNG